MSHFYRFKEELTMFTVGGERYDKTQKKTKTRSIRRLRYWAFVCRWQNEWVFSKMTLPGAEDIVLEGGEKTYYCHNCKFDMTVKKDNTVICPSCNLIIETN